MENEGPLFPISSIVDWIDFLQLFLYCCRSALLRLGPLATYGWCHERSSLFVFRRKWTHNPKLFVQMLFPRERLKIVFCCIYSVGFPIFQYVCQHAPDGILEIWKCLKTQSTTYVPAHIWKWFAWQNVLLLDLWMTFDHTPITHTSDF